MSSNSHENLEKVLKIFMDKLKFSLGLDYRNTDYSIQLVDRLSADFIIKSGETATIMIRTERYLDSVKQDAFRQEGEYKPADRTAALNFRIDLEKNLRLVKRMINTLDNPAIAPALIFNSEKGKFRKSKEPVYEHPIEAEIQYTNDHRSTAIHWKSGLLVREFGPTKDSAVQKARGTIIRLLQDETIFRRNEDAFLRIEPHEDIIFDMVLEAKSLTKDEIVQLIDTLKKEYLKDET